MQASRDVETQQPQPSPGSPSSTRAQEISGQPERGPGTFAEDGDKANPAADTAGTRDAWTMIRGPCAMKQTGQGLHQEAAGPKRPLTSAGYVNYAH